VVLDPSVPPRPIQEGSATLREVDDWYIGRVLAHTGGNYAAAARILGMDRATVRRRASRLNE
jgi:transcriptional regulator with GAF, ATPase, and Fis domain